MTNAAGRALWPDLEMGEGRSRGHWRRKLEVAFLLLEQFGI